MEKGLVLSAQRPADDLTHPELWLSPARRQGGAHHITATIKPRDAIMIGLCSAERISFRLAARVDAVTARQIVMRAVAKRRRACTLAAEIGRASCRERVCQYV